MDKYGVMKMSLPLIGQMQIELYLGGSGTRLMGHYVLVDVREDGHITSWYHFGGLCMMIQYVRPNGGMWDICNRQNDHRFLLRASQFDPSKQELGRPA